MCTVVNSAALYIIFKQLESNRSAKLERRLSKKPMLDTIRVGGMEGYCN